MEGPAISADARLEPARASRAERLSRWLAWLAMVAAALLIVTFCCQRIWSVDYWWQLKSGEYITQHGPPQKDVYSYTNPDHDRLELRWGYCWALYHIVQRFGPEGATIVKAALVTLMFTLAVLAALPRRQPGAVGEWGPLAAAAVVTIAALASSQRLVVRPETISNLLVAFYIFSIARRMIGPTRWVWALPAAQAIWANVHGLFALGPAIVGAWIVGEVIEHLVERARGKVSDPDRPARIRSAAIILALCAAASLINPYTYRAVLLPIMQFAALHGTSQKGFIGELNSPFMYSNSFVAIFYYKALLGLAVLSLTLNITRARAFWVILIASQAYLSAVAVRNIPLFAVVAIPFVLINFRDSWLWRSPLAVSSVRAARPVAALGVICLALFTMRDLVTDRFAVKQGDTNQFGLGLAERRFPTKAAEFLKASGAEGPIFNTVGAGAVLLEQGFKVFIDPRMEVYQDGIIEEYSALVAAPERLAEYTARRNLEVLFLETDSTRLIGAVARDPAWRLVYADPVAVIFFRADTMPGVPTLDLAQHPMPWFDEMRRSLPEPKAYEEAGLLDRVIDPTPYRRLASICNAFGQRPLAARFYEQALAVYPPGFTAMDYFLLSYASASSPKAAAEYANRAAELLLKAQRINPNNLDIVRNLARVQLALGHKEDAAESIRRALEINPSDPDSLALQREIGAAQR